MNAGSQNIVIPKFEFTLISGFTTLEYLSDIVNLESPGLLLYPEMIADFPVSNAPVEAVTGPIKKIKIRVKASNVNAALVFILPPYDDLSSYDNS